ncbi:MAG: discoidin domain-containing protein, partial [Desulfuromonadales bacterium]|nr:discoidin domain-containing protein [Desulfuromonadales bacterium]
SLTVIADTKPNLVVSGAAMSALPLPALEGGDVLFSAVISNTGSSESAPTTVRLYHGVPEEGGTLLKEYAIPTLNSGGTTTITYDWSGITESDSLLFVVIADADDIVAEGNEDDNIGLLLHPVLSLPELSLSASSIVTVPTVPKVADTVRIDVTVINSGDQSVTDVPVQLIFNGTPLASQSLTTAGQSQAVVSFTLPTITAEGTYDLTVTVDPAGLIQERDRGNNSVRTKLTVQNADLWVSNPIFSPNGDGEKDTTTIGFRLFGVESFSLDLTDIEGETIRTIESANLSAGGGTVVWEGYTDAGMIADDGRYTFRILNAAGGVLKQVAITIDNNRSSLGDALLGGETLLQNITCELPDVDLQWLPDESGFVFTIAPDQANENWLPGLYTMSPGGGDAQLLTPEDWLTSTNTKDSLSLVRWGMSPDGRYVYLQRRIVRDTSTFFNPYRFTTLVHDIWLYDLSSGEFRLLDSNLSSYYLSNRRIFWSPTGDRIFTYAPSFNYYASGSLSIYYVDGREKTILDAGPYLKLDASTWAPDGKTLFLDYRKCDSEVNYDYWSGHSCSERLKRFSSIYNDETADILPLSFAADDNYDWPEWMDGSLVLSGGVDENGKWDYLPNVPLRLVDYGGSIQYLSDKARDGDFLISPDKKFIAFVDIENIVTTQRASVKIYTYLGDQVVDYSVNVPYPNLDASMNDQNASEPCGYSKPDTLTVSDLAWSSDSRYLTFIDRTAEILGGCYYNGELVTLDAVQTSFSKTPLYKSKFLCTYDKRLDDDYISYNGSPYTCAIPPDKTLQNYQIAIKKHIPNSSILIGTDSEGIFTLDRRTGFRSDLNLPEGVTANNLYTSPLGGYLYFKDSAENSLCPANSRYDTWIVTNADNLMAEMRIVNDGSKLYFVGTATDLNFKLYNLEYEEQSNPGEWVLIQPPSAVPVIDGVLGYWVPPYDGTYNVRLTVSDTSGNKQTVVRSVFWSKDSDLARVYLSNPLISPNDDGVKDEAVLYYSALKPVELTFIVKSSSGSVVRYVERIHATPGEYAFVWDGRDDSGSLLPDGSYSVSVQDLSFPITIDTTLPDSTISYKERILSAYVHDSNPAGWVIEKAYTQNSEAWSAVREGNGNVGLEVKLKDVHLFSEEELSDLHGAWFRLAVTDAAGNVGVSLPIQMPEELRLTFWDLPAEREKRSPESFQLYFASLVEQKLRAYETYAGQLSSWQIEYSTTINDYVADVLVEEVAGVYKIFWTDFVRDEGLKRIRLIAVDSQGNRVESLAYSISINPLPQIDDSSSGGSGDGTGGTQEPDIGTSDDVELTVEAIVTDSECGLLSDAVNINISALGAAPVTPLEIKLYLDNAPVDAPTYTIIGQANHLQRIDYASLSTGMHTVMVHYKFESRITGGVYELTDSVTFVVDRVLPDASLTGFGTLIRSTSNNVDRIGIPISGNYADDFGVKSVNLSYRRLDGVSSDWKETTYYDGIKPAPIANGFSGELTIWDVSALPEGSYELSMAVTDNAGNRACSLLIFTQNLSVDVLNFSVSSELFSPNGDGAFDDVSVFLQTAQPVTVNYSVYAMQSDGQSGALINTFVPEMLCASGSCVVQRWNGLNSNGALAAEGDYLIVVLMRDSLGNQANRSARVRIDITAPIVALPEAQFSTPFGPLLNIQGTVYDLHKVNYNLEISEGLAPVAWTSLQTGNWSMQDAFLGVWDNNGLMGDWSLRLSATDEAGNSSETITTVSIPDRSPLLTSISISPEYVSPNADGIQDQAVILYELVAASDVTFTIKDKDLVTVKTVSSQHVDSGQFQFIWNGDNDLAQAVAGGVYSINLFANATDGSGRVWSDELAVIIDKLQPEVEIPLTQFTTPFGIGLEVQGTVSDQYLLDYVLEVGEGVSPSVWSSISTGERNRLNESLGKWNNYDLEGEWSFRLSAKDKAGNSSETIATATIPSRIPLLSSITLAPEYISPNADGIQDQSVIRYDLVEPVNVTLTIQDQSKQTVYTVMYNHSEIGQFEFAWNGNNDLGQPVADGKYSVNFSVSANDGTQRVWTEELSVVVDTLQPVIKLLNPVQNSYLDIKSLSIDGSIDDLNLDNYTLALESGGGALPLEQGGLLTNQSQLAALAAISEGNYLLNLHAVDLAGNTTAVSSAFVIDRTAPVVSILSPLAGSLYGGTDANLSEVRGLVDDLNIKDYKVRYGAGINPEVWVDVVSVAGAPIDELLASLDFTQGIEDGSYQISVVATDLAGHDSEAVVNVEVDHTAPQLSFAPMPNADYVSQPFSIVGDYVESHPQSSALLLASGSCASATNWTPLTNAVSPATNAVIYEMSVLPPDNTYCLKFEAEDSLGQKTAITKEIVVDRTPPVISLTIPSDRALYGESDLSGIEIRGLIQETNPQDYVVRYGAGSNPAIWMDVVSAFGAAADEILASLDFSVGITDGPYTVSVVATDMAQNVNEAVVSIEIDRLAPELGIDPLPNAGYVSQPFSIIGKYVELHPQSSGLLLATGSCANATTWTPLGQNLQPGESAVLYNWPVLPADNTYCLKFEAEDLVGLRTELLNEFVVDTIPPTAPVLTAVVDNDGNVVLNWVPAGGESAIGYNIYRQNIRLNTALVTSTERIIPGLSEGTYSFDVRALDSAGNESSPSNTEIVRIDRTAPFARILYPQEGAIVNGQINIRGTAFSSEDFREYRVYTSIGETPINWILVRTSPVPVSSGILTSVDVSGVDGVVHILLEADDHLLNTSSDQVSVTIDRTPPAPPLNLAAIETGSNISLTWEASPDADVAGYLLYRNGKLAVVDGNISGSLLPYVVNGTDYQDLNVPDGVVRYFVVALDGGENFSLPSNTVELTLDTHAPNVVIDDPLPGHAFDAPIIIRGSSADLDIAEVVFSYRMTGEGEWIELAVVNQSPFSALFDPEALGLTYGFVDLQAIAVDLGGKQSLNPDSVQIEYADVTSPMAPLNPGSRVSGDTVTIDWGANIDTDLAGYLVFRLDGATVTQLTSMPIPELIYVDPGLLDGYYTYEIAAVDLSGNQSLRSASGVNIIYAPSLIQPEPYQLVPLTTVSGSDASSGNLVELYSNSAGDLTLLTTTVSAADQGFSFDFIALETGLNLFQARVVDASGNSSRFSETIAIINAELLPPDGLTAAVSGDGFNIQLNWGQSVEDYIVGYRLYRDRSVLGQPIETAIESASSPDTRTYSYALPQNAIDGYSYSIWRTNSHDSNMEPYTFDLKLGAPSLVNSVEIDWDEWGDDYAAEFSILSNIGGEWVEVVHVFDNLELNTNVNFPPVFTDQIRIELIRTNNWGYAIHEIRVFKAPVLTDNNYLDAALSDGTHTYRVSSIDRFNNESALSAPVQVEVGDVDPPAQPVAPTVIVSGADVTLDWSATPNSESDLGGYNIYRHIDGTWQKINPTLVDVSFFKEFGVLNGNHLYRITAIDLVGNESLPSNEVTALVNVALSVAQITNITTLPEGGALLINWQTNADGYSFNLYRRQSDASVPIKVNSEPLWDYSLIDEGLVNGDSYYYSVSLVDPIGNESDPSPEVVGIPLDTHAPGSPVLIAPVGSGGTVRLAKNMVEISGIVDGASTVEILSAGFPVASVALLPSGTETVMTYADYGSPLVVSSDGTKFGTECYYTTGACIADMVTGNVSSYGFDYAGLVWSPNLSKVVYTDYYGSMKVLTPQTSEIVELIDFHDLSAYEQSWSLDETKLVFVGNQIGYTSDVWLYDFSDASLKQLTSGIEVFSVSLSPDGSLVAYLDATGLSVLDIASDATVLFREHVEIKAEWSPDGNKIAYEQVLPASTSDLIVYSFENNEQSVVSSGEYNYSRYLPFKWSPDGAFIAYQAGYDDLVVVASSENRKIFEITSDVWDFGWLPDSRLILLDSQEQIVYQPLPGFFKTNAIDLNPGENVFYAIATDPSGNQSSSSEVITIIRD